ncbi:hypothetical protein ACJX0J_006176, partial [Zea mays]
GFDSVARPPQAFAPSNAILSRILAGNGAIHSLTVNCSLLDDSAASVIARGSLRDLLLLKCSFSMSFFVALGGACHDLRSLKLEMAVCPYTLYPCLAPVYVGCVHLETLWVKFPLLDPLTTFRTLRPNTIVLSRLSGSGKTTIYYQ